MLLILLPLRLLLGFRGETYNGALGIPMLPANRTPTILELAKKNGKTTGMSPHLKFQDATPAFATDLTYQPA